ncbi:MAG: YIP1 family protein [Nanoarchaeota archaeon]
MNILNKIKLILFYPDKFFSSLKEKTIQDSLLYYIILLAFNVIMGYLILLIFGDVFIRYLYNLFNLNLALPTLNAINLFGQVILGYILAIAFSFLMVGILYVWLLIFGGNKGYAKTYQLYAYSQTPSLLLKWIPFLSFFIWIYDLVLLIIGTKKIYNFSTTKAVLIYVIPTIIIFIIVLFVFIGILAVLRRTNLGVY